MICHKDTRARRQHEVSLCFLGALVSLWRAFPLVTIHSLVCTYDMPAGPLPTVIVRATSSVFRSMTDRVFAPLLEMNAHRPSAERLMALGDLPTATTFSDASVARSTTSTVPVAGLVMRIFWMAETTRRRPGTFFSVTCLMTSSLSVSTTQSTGSR